MQIKKPKIVTIGGGNGHSNILGAIQDTFIQHVDLSAIVSMSDDGRTTGRLMRYFHDELGIHFPPPGDVRRCLYFLSGSAFRPEFEKYFETVITIDVPIHSLSLGEILFHHFDDDYIKMMDFMHQFLKVASRVIPVTIDSAYIQAKLDDGTIIERQDNISNNIGYTGRIVELSLMPESETARHNTELNAVISAADYILIAPGDIYTSTISNLIIGGVADLIAKYSQAKIIFIANNTNKGGEASGYQIQDFVSEIEKYLGKNIDILVANNEKLNLSISDANRFKNDISVKGGDYIYLSDDERQKLTERGTQIIEADILDRKTLYKHDKKKIATILEKIIFHSK